MAAERSAWAEGKAREVLRSLGITAPEMIDIEAIAFSRGVLVLERPLRGMSARLLRRGSRGIVTVRSDLRERGQKRFAIAHELGHFELHKKHSDLEICTEEAIERYKAQPEEVEASQFAAALLMPDDLFRQRCQGRKPTRALLMNLTAEFSTTLTATLIRYVEAGCAVSAVVASRDGTIQWFRRSPDFRFWLREPGTKVHPHTVAGEVFTGDAASEDLETVPACAWLADKTVEDTWTIGELTVAQPRYSSTVSLLWVVPGSDLDRA